MKKYLSDMLINREGNYLTQESNLIKELKDIIAVLEGNLLMLLVSEQS